eukprot:4485314-Prymnesium_polylepis.1
MRRLGFDGSAAVCRIGMRAAWRLGLGCEGTACSTLGEGCVAIRIWAAVRRKQRARAPIRYDGCCVPHPHQGCVAIWIRTRLREHHCGDEGCVWI